LDQLLSRVELVSWSVK